MKEIDEFPEGIASSYEKTGLLADPIYGYIETTRPHGDIKFSEQDIINHPWMQRARRIHQLQGISWVFPGAEHSRFQHSLGAMHLAGKWAKHLYENLPACFEDVPSLPLVEETLRMGGLLHDIGHGPFGHLCDQAYLEKYYGINHEILSQQIILKLFSRPLSELKASPSGNFAPGEAIDPRWIAYIISKEPLPGFEPPAWLDAMKPILCGRYAADNMDYVPRDSYMCGVHVEVDVDRMIRYTFMTPNGIALLDRGEASVRQFLNARLYLYSELYKHRTAETNQLHMREILPETCDILMDHENPEKALDKYFRLTDWYVVSEVENWTYTAKKGTREAELGKEWRKLVNREKIKWQLVHQSLLDFAHTGYSNPKEYAQDFTEQLRNELPLAMREVKLDVEVDSLGGRPQDVDLDVKDIMIYDPKPKSYKFKSASEVMQLRGQTSQLRVFAIASPKVDAEIQKALPKLLSRTLKQRRKTDINIEMRDSRAETENLNWEERVVG